MLVRPGQIVYTGDGSGFLAGPGRAGRHPKPGKLTWTSWTGGAALGSGDDWLNNCEPFCAAGTFSQHAVNIKLYRPRTMLRPAGVHADDAALHAQAQPVHAQELETFKLVRAGSQLFWNIPS